MKKLLISICILFFSVIYCQAVDTPTNLKTDEKTQPGIAPDIAGVENPEPKFSWTVDPSTDHTHYQLILADNLGDIGNNTGNVWDSGKEVLVSSECYYDETAGETLLSNNTYYWKVKTWDVSGSSSSYSSSTSFRMNHFIKRQDIDMGFVKGQMAFAVGDINGDGLRDYVQAEYNSTYVSAYINTGTGTFKTGWQSPSENNSQAIALADIDNDGDLDLIVLNCVAKNKIYTNNGEGNFSFKEEFGYSDDSRAIAVGDINRDGNLDFVAGNYTGKTAIYFNDGTGNFSEARIESHPSDNTRDILLADLNGDSYLDLIVGNFGEVNRVYLNTKISTGPYKDTADWESTETEKTMALTLIDIEGDGDWDFITGNRDEKDRYYENDGNGSFLTSYTTTEIPGDGTYTLSSGDIDNDGDMDYVEGNYGPTSYRVRVYVNKGAVPFFLSYNFFSSALVYVYKLNLNDFTGDGAMDLLRGIQGNNIDNFLVHYSSISNTGPDAPSSGLSACYESLKLKLQWNPPTDDHTQKKQLSYNIRLGTSPGNYNVISGAIGSTDNSGSFWGNIGRSTYVYLNVEPKAYFWQVQAIDTSKSTGAWSEEQMINESPICGWETDNILLSTCAVQWTMDKIISTTTIVENRRGLVDIYFKIKDSERLDSILTGFEYSTVTINGWHSLSDTSTFLTLNDYPVEETNLWPDNQEDMFKTASITSTWSNAAPYHFTWDSNDMPELQNIQCDETRIKFKAYDIFGSTSVDFVQSELFSIDNLNPTRPGELSASLIYGNTYYTVNYGATSADNNFLEYKIFIGTDNPSVDLTSYDSIWDENDDLNLSSVTFGGASSTTITGLSEDTTYYLKLYAFDEFGNYNSTTTYSIKTNDPPDLEVVKITATQRTDGFDLVDITFYGIDNDIEYSSYVWKQCFFKYKVDGSTEVMTSSTTDSNFSKEPLEFKKTRSTYTFVWDAGKNVPDISSDTFRVKIVVTDGRAYGSTGWTDNFTVDTLPPDYGYFKEIDASYNSIDWEWNQTNEEHFARYELWYSSKSPDYAISKDTNNADYITLYNNVNSTTTSGLQETTDYWGCLWIYDFYGHESHTSTASSKTGYLPNTVFSLQPDPLKDGSGNILVKVDVSDKDGNVCKMKVEYILGGSTIPATIDVTDSTHGNAYDCSTCTYQIKDIVTYDTGLVTNTVTFNWCSKTDKDNIYDETVFLKITVNDGILDGNTKISSPFKIDNSQPVFNKNKSPAPFSQYTHYKSSFTIFFKGEDVNEENEVLIGTEATRFLVEVSTFESINLSGSLVTGSTNCVQIKINDENRNQIARWDGEGKIPYLVILSSAARDDYGNYSIGKSSIEFNKSGNANYLYWVPDEIPPEVIAATYAISGAGEVNLEIGFDEYMDILSLTTVTISGITIQGNPATSSPHEELDSSCDIRTLENDSKTLLINIPCEKHKTIWSWGSTDIYLTINANTIADPSGNGITPILEDVALLIGTFISTETPKVIENSPCGYNISRNSIITVKFNESLEPCVSNSIYVKQIKNSENKDVNYTISCGSITYNKEDKLLTFTPKEELPGNSVISILIDRDYIENFGGVKMKENFVWNFKTALKNDDDNLFISPSGNFTVYVSKNMLPFDGRVEFTEEIPPNTPIQTQMAAILRANTAESSWKNPYHYQFEDLTTEIVFYSTSGVFNTLNFEKNVELTIDYSDCLLNENPEYLRYGNNPPVKENTIKIYYLNEQLNIWIPVNTRLNEEENKISAYIRHFSVYTIMGAQNHDIENAHPYPVPYKPTARVEDGGIPTEFAGTLRSGITFTDLPSECDIEIYTIAGRLVQTMHHFDADLQINGYVGNRYWYPVQNLYDEDVVSGVYIYYIEGENKHKMGKVMIIR